MTQCSRTRCSAIYSIRTLWHALAEIRSRVSSGNFLWENMVNWTWPPSVKMSVSGQPGFRCDVPENLGIRPLFFPPVTHADLLRKLIDSRLETRNTNAISLSVFSLRCSNIRLQKKRTNCFGAWKDLTWLCFQTSERPSACGLFREA